MLAAKQSNKTMPSKKGKFLQCTSNNSTERIRKKPISTTIAKKQGINFSRYRLNLETGDNTKRFPIWFLRSQEITTDYEIIPDHAK